MNRIFCALLLLHLIVPRSAEACHPVGMPSSRLLRGADSAYLATATSTTHDFSIDRTLRGPRHSTLFLSWPLTHDWACSSQSTVPGRRYLVFLFCKPTPIEDGFVLADCPAHAEPLQSAQALLRYLTDPLRLSRNAFRSLLTAWSEGTIQPSEIRAWLIDADERGEPTDWFCPGGEDLEVSLTNHVLTRLSAFRYPGVVEEDPPDDLAALISLLETPLDATSEAIDLLYALE